MKFYEIILLGVGLSMDAFAVSICRGIKMRPFNKKQAAITALAFGLAQGLMPLIGWLVGKQFESYITAFDHWIAFGLLAFIGVKMIIESLKQEKEQNECNDFKIKELIIMAVATSIDALAVGITFAFLPVKTSIYTAVLIIAAITFAFCYVGGYVGFKFGDKLKNKAELIGGIVLILIGLKILLEHLNLLPF